jgi:ribosomal protein L19E
VAAPAQSPYKSGEKRPSIMKIIEKESIMKKWSKLFTRKGGKLYWKESRGRKAAGSEAGTNHGDGYKTVRIDGKAVYVHRIVK